MALPIATISYDLSDLGDIDFDSRRTKVYATTNIPGDTIADTAGDKIHLGGTNGTVNADGTGSIGVKIPAAGSNPTAWQTYIHVDYGNKTKHGQRETRTFGPYTIAGDANLADLVAQIPAPPDMPSAISLAAADQKYAAKSLEADVDAVESVTTSLQSQINAVGASGKFKGAYNSATTYAQGDQVTSGGAVYGAPSAIAAGVTPPTAPWVLMPSGTDLVVRNQLRSSVPGATITNLAAIPVPYIAPAPSTGWGHGGATAGANTRVNTGGPSGLAPAFYRRTFSATATGVNSIYYTIDGITAGQRYAFRMNGRGSWNGRRLLQVSWRDSGGATLSTVQSEWTDIVPANTWKDLSFVPSSPAPAGAVAARVLYVVEVGGVSATPGNGDTIDGTAAMGVLGTRAYPFANGDSPIGTWNGVAQQSTSSIYIPARTTPIPNLWTVSPATGAADFTTITEAVAACANGDTVQLYPGTYREQVPAWPVFDLHLVGVDKSSCVLISSTGQYATPPLEIGSGSVRNMTIIEDHLTGGTDVDINTGDQRAYSIHPDNYYAMVGRSLLLEDLILRNTRRPVIGCGLYQGTTVTVRNCDIESGPPVLAGDRKRGAIYFHGRDTSLDSASTTDQHIVLERNRVVHTGGDHVFYLYDAGSPTYPSVLDVLCIGNYMWSETDGVADIMGGTGFTTDVTLHPGSYGNNVAALNA